MCHKASIYGGERKKERNLKISRQHLKTIDETERLTWKIVNDQSRGGKKLLQFHNVNETSEGGERMLSFVSFSRFIFSRLLLPTAAAAPAMYFHSLNNLLSSTTK
jgi:hypothetical protein